VSEPTHTPLAGSSPVTPSQAKPGAGRLARLKALGRGRKGIWAAVAVLLLIAATLGSVLGARAVARSDAAKAQLSFHLASDEIASTLRLAIQHEEDLVVSAGAFVISNPKASPADFDRWAESVHAMQR
jgi:hypothetical protein